MRLLGLSGKAGAGKNYIARTVLAPLGYREVALADELKIRAIATGVATYEEAFHTKPPRVRTWMQQEGTERGRQLFGEDVWVNALLARMARVQETWGIDTFVVTDVRFPNEVTGIQAAGGRVLRVDAPERVAASPLSPEARQHASETALDGFDGFDGVIQNDPVFGHTVAWQMHVHLMRAGWIDQVPTWEPTVTEMHPLLQQLVMR